MAAGAQPYPSTQVALGQAFDPTQKGLRQASADGPILATKATVGVAAALLLASALAARSVVLIRPGADIQIGPDNAVTTANGFTIAANTTLTLEVGPGVAIWAIASGAGVDVRVLEIA